MDSIEEYNRILEEADEAILAGTEMYKLVTNHLQHLGKELHDYESELEADNGIAEQSEKRSLELDVHTYRNNDKENTSLNKENRMRMRAEKRRKRRSNRESRSQTSGSFSRVSPVLQTRHGRRTATLTASSNDAVVEDAVEEEGASEPNEPRYCVCNQVSYGDMIACDNEKCKQEWFHYACVAVTTPPKGKWYCPQCKHKMRYKRPHNRTEL